MSAVFYHCQVALEYKTVTLYVDNHLLHKTIDKSITVTQSTVLNYQNITKQKPRKMLVMTKCTAGVALSPQSGHSMTPDDFCSNRVSVPIRYRHLLFDKMANIQVGCLPFCCRHPSWYKQKCPI